FVGDLPGWSFVQNSTAGDLLSTLKWKRFRGTDAEALRRGYYEDLDVARRDTAVGAALNPEGEYWPVGLYHRPTEDFLLYEPIPGFAQEIQGKQVTINRWGMRDRERQKAKPPGVCRIAVLGSSGEMGHGIGDEDCLTRILEERL